MRAYQGLAALVVVAALAVPARAQRAYTFGGGNNANVTYSVVDTSGSNVPISTPETRSLLSSRIINFFHTPTKLNNNRIIGQSNYPTKSQLPGINYLQGFKYSRGGQ